MTSPINDRLLIWEHLTPLPVNSGRGIIYSSHGDILPTTQIVPEGNWGALLVYDDGSLRSEENLARFCDRIVPGGSIAILFPSRRNINAHRKRIEDNSFTVDGVFALLPSTTEPRLLIPLHNRRIARSSFSVYTPGKRIGLAKSYLLSCAAALGLLKFLAADFLLVGLKTPGPEPTSIEVEPTLRSIVESFFLCKCHFAVHLGSRIRTEQRFTGLILNDKGESLGFFKIARDERSRKALRHEAEILSTLNNYPALKGTIPQILGEWETSSACIVIMSASDIKSATQSYRFTRTHSEFLAAMYSSSLHTLNWKSSQVRMEFEDDLAHVLKLTEPPTGKTIRDKASKVEIALNGHPIPQTFAHRDFVPWNIKTGRDRIFVFDWEYATQNSIPYWDVFNFLIHTLPVEKRKRRFLLRHAMEIPIRHAGEFLPITSKPAENSEFEILNRFYFIYCINYLARLLRESTNIGEIGESVLTEILNWQGE